MKKILCILLALALALGAVAAAAEESAQPPEMPSGGMTPPDWENGQPPEMPDGQRTPPDWENGQPPEMPDGNGAPPEGNPGGAGGMPPGSGASTVEYAAATEITEAAELSEGTFVSETPGENALRINTSDAVTVTDPTVTKTGDSGGDACSFYGVNAAVLVTGGSVTTVIGGTVETSASGANGVFSYGGNGGMNGAEGDGTTVILSGTTITTTGDSSGGIMTAGGGITYAIGLNVTTSGRSSAAIRTDRGGGTVSVDGGIYTTSGLGSPAIYSTADITVKNAILNSSLSEGVCIEGMNSVTLENCDLTASNTQCNGNATFHDTIMIYQSMSGDADSGTSFFTMSGGRLASLSGHMFHVTNTHAVITLSGVELLNEGSDILLSVCDDGWNGASNIAELNADGQALAGIILVGSNSTLSLSLVNGSSFEGCISGEIVNAKGETVSTQTGTVSVSIDSTSTWTLTADTSVSAFDGDAQNVISNGYTLTVDGTPLEGTR